jgi:outer membrane protein assembly factor BamB
MRNTDLMGPRHHRLLNVVLLCAALTPMSACSGPTALSRNLCGDVGTPSLQTEGTSGVTYSTLYEGADDGNLSAFNLASGNLKWKLPLGKTSAAIKTSPFFSRGRIFVGSNDGHVYAVDSATHTVVWDFATKASVHSSPTLEAVMNLSTSGSPDGA